MDIQSETLIGTWRRFGALGPVYEIIALGKKLSGGNDVMRVRVLETGEEVDYQVARILEDPREG